MARRLLIPAVCLLAPALWLALATEPDQVLHADALPPVGEGAPEHAALPAATLAAEPVVRTAEPLDPAPSPDFRRPRVRHTDRRFDWGEVPANQSFGHVFTLHNDGDAVLHIQKLRPS